jgi:hypothetical protein
MINATFYNSAFENVSQYGSDSINFSAPHLRRGPAATREQSARAQRRVLVRCKFAAKNSENSDALDWARAVRRNDLRSWAQFPRRTAIRSCCFVGKVFLRSLGVAMALRSV